MELSPQAFEQLVQSALELIPGEFRSFLANVAIIIEAEPGKEHREGLRIPRGETLYGLYHGPSLPQRSADESGLPARITIFRGPHLRWALDLEDLEQEVARTIIHEVAHHFGIGEERLAELGWD